METVSNKDGTQPGEGGKSLALTAAGAAIGVNIVLTVLKFILAWYSKSLALKVEAFHSLADVGSSIAVFVAVRAEMKSRGAKGKLGPQRIVAVFIGAFLLVTGIVFLRKIVTPEVVTVGSPAPVALFMLLLALLSFLLARFERIAGEKEKCTALIADSFHSRVDMFGSLVVAGALLIESLGLQADRLAAGILAAFIITQSANVFGAVIHDLAKGEGGEEILYRDWLFAAIRNRLPRITPRALIWFIRLTGGSPAAEPDRKKARRALAVLSAAAVLVFYLASGLFTVKANDRAIVERLGRPIEQEAPLGPGLHYRIPWPVDFVRKVDVTTIRRLNLGSTVAPGRRTVLWTNQHYVEQFNLLSGENVFVDVGVAIHYRVKDAAAWLYHTRDPEAVLSSVTYAEVTEAFAGLPLLDTITQRRDEVEKDLSQRIASALSAYDTGIEIVTVQLRDVHPPADVSGDFENVVSATIEYETRINEARGYQNGLIPRARGEAAASLMEAGAGKIAASKRARGDAEFFGRLRDAYNEAPEAARARFKLESAESVLPGREKILVPASAASGTIELFMTVDPGVNPVLK